MKQLDNKKGAVEMSLNLIIMLIIGIVVLGLVIGFVNNLVSQGESTYRTQLNDNEKLKLDEVDRCPDNLCIIPDPSVELKKGEQVNVFLKARAYDTAIDCGAGPLTSCEVAYEVVDNSGTTIANDQLSFSGPGIRAGVGEHDSKMYALTAANELPIGTYYITIGLYDDGSGSYDTSKTLTVYVE